MNIVFELITVALTLLFSIQF